MIALPLLLVAQLVCNGTSVELAPDTKLPAGQCSIAKPIVNDRALTITGAANLATSIRAQRGFIGGSGKLTLRDIEIWRADSPTETGTRAIALNLSGSSDVQRVRLAGFTIGGLITGAEELRTNADWTVWRDVEIVGSAFTALMLDGGVVNGGTFEHIRLTTACERPELWEKYFGATCTALYDGSFLGNYFEGLLISGTHFYRPPLIVRNKRSPGNNHSTFMGTYCEGGQAAPILDLRTVMIGGLCEGTPALGLRIDGRMISGAEFTNDQLVDGSKKMTARVRLGRAASPGAFACLAGDEIDKSKPLCIDEHIFGAELAQKCYRSRIANSLFAGETCQDGSRK